MNLSINLGVWNSVFAVPTSIVDKHIKLAGAAQLKVLLWVLRHAGEDFSTDEIAKVLSMHPADVKDSLQYWVETKVLAICDNEIIPKPADTQPEQKPDPVSEVNPITPDNSEPKPQAPKRLRPISRSLRPDTLYTAERINADPEIQFLTQEAQIILGRPISNGDCATLLMLYDNDGLPIDVIIMLMQYAVSVGKANMNYIEKVGISWASEEIDTIEKAENKIRILVEARSAWNFVRKVVGLEKRSPTEKEQELCNRWVNEWSYNEQMIREAYERCVNAKGKYIAAYMDTIIKRWHKMNINSIEQANEEKLKANPQKSKPNEHSPSYNIEEYENYSIFDDDTE